MLKILVNTAAADVNDVELFRTLSNSTLTWRGGNTKYYCNKLLDMTTVNLNDWVDSLEGNVVLLENFFNYISLDYILFNYPSEDVKAYAQHFLVITPEDRPNIATLLLASEETVEPDPESGSKFYTRKDASDHSKSECVIL